MPPIRTLFLMLDCEFPPKTGTPLGIWRNMVALSKLGPIAVFSVRYNECPWSALPGVERWHHVEKSKLDSRSALRKVYERISRLFFPAQYPFFHLQLEKKANLELRKLIADFRPTVVVIDHWLNAIVPSPLLNRNLPLVIASHDVEWQLLADLKNPDWPLHKRLMKNAELFYFRWVEKRLYRAAARTWAVSEVDRRAIQRLTGLSSEIRTLPAVTEIEFYEPVRQKTMVTRRNSTAGGPTLMYAGGYSFTPNADAARVLINDIYPAVRASYPGTRLLLVGPNPRPEMEAAARSDDHIDVTGKVDDIRPYLAQADISVAPLLVGGGMRTKIIEAFASSLPVVSTTKGAEGIPVQDGKELLVRDGVSDFVAGIKEIWENPARARALAERGFEFVRREHSMEAMDARMRAELDELLTAR